MELVSKQEFKNFINYKSLGKDLFTDAVFQLLKLNKVNELYEKHYKKSPLEFIDAIIDYLGIHIEISSEDLERIPKTGPFVIISNHPYGALDGIIMCKVISQKRPDFKVMANFLLHRIEPLKDFIFPVNPFETMKDLRSSVNGLRNAYNYVAKGHPLGIFPAGEVSSFNISENRIADKEWESGIIKFILKCNVPVIPVYVSGTNSPLFHALGRIHPLLRTVKLPSELFNKKDKKVQVRIGTPISVEALKKIGTVKETGRYLRAKTYALGNTLDIDTFYKQPLWDVKKKPMQVMDAIDKTLLVKEVEKNKTAALLFEMGDYSVMCAKAENIPNLILEIGRLREVSFREVSGGTNKSTDLDQYDVYYHHLFIWDNKKQQLVGAYRIGKGKDIIEKYGIQGFYTRSLFKLDEQLKPLLLNSIELGRSFITKEYQKKAMPLFLLWKGIFYFLLQNKDYRYLIGPVSISSKLSKFSKSLIVSFVKSNCYDYELAQYVKPRKQFKIQQKYMPEIDCLVNDFKNDFNNIDNIVSEIENNQHIPVLLKKYLSLNAKIIGFNIDPLFNDCLDGLMILDYFNVPQQVIESLSKEMQKESSSVSNIDFLTNRKTP
jgi:putative hemolysin